MGVGDNFREENSLKQLDDIKKEQERKNSSNQAVNNDKKETDYDRAANRANQKYRLAGMQAELVVKDTLEAKEDKEKMPSFEERKKAAQSLKNQINSLEGEKQKLIKETTPRADRDPTSGRQNPHLVEGFTEKSDVLNRGISEAKERYNIVNPSLKEKTKEFGKSIQASAKNLKPSLIKEVKEISTELKKKASEKISKIKESMGERKQEATRKKQEKDRHFGID